ncbi:MAG: hypothetical protein KDD44_12850, partial [Bdellovibrionales bacterium]|nr:hypothetical protein [Bdellovibrionales bacterium]
MAKTFDRDQALSQLAFVENEYGFLLALKDRFDGLPKTLRAYSNRASETLLRELGVALEGSESASYVFSSQDFAERGIHHLLRTGAERWS